VLRAGEGLREPPSQRLRRRSRRKDETPLGLSSVKGCPATLAAVSHRREQKEALRREREERERQARAAEQRKKLVGYGAGGLLALAAVVVLLLVAGGDSGSSDAAAAEVFPDGGSIPEQEEFEVGPAAEAAGCELKTTEARGEQDRLHTDSPDVDVKYRGNPPTLGRHWPPGFQAEDGLYGDSPADEALVHTMEHGRVVIWAKPSLPEDARSTLRALFDEDDYQLVLTPRANMPYAVAATAWNGDPAPEGVGRTLGCPDWNEQVVDALRAFRDEHRSRGPEPIP
jgi:Protein of unknown function (DUF3105)